MRAFGKAATAGLCLVVAFPNLAVLERLWSVVALPRLEPALGAGLLQPLRAVLLLGYVLAVLALMPPVARGAARVLDRGPRRPLLAAALLVLAAFASTTWIYPAVDGGRYGFTSDRDEAVDVGARELAAGRNPYACRVVPGEHRDCRAQGNPIGPLPGALLLAAPFVLLLGLGALQTPFWLGAWLAVAARASGGAAIATGWTFALFACAPIVLAEIVTGGDLLANALWVTAGVLLLATRPRLDGPAWLAAIFLGVLLCGRSHFALVLPVLGLFLWRRWGFLQAAAAMLACVAAFLALALPYYLLDPPGFGPLQVQQKLRDLGGTGSQGVALALSALLAAGLGLLARELRSLMACCACALLVPVLYAVAQQSLAAGRVDFGFFAWYGLAATPFALVALMRAAPAGGASLRHTPLAGPLA